MSSTMLAVVVAHVGDDPPHLRRCAKRATVIPVGEDGAAALHHAVETLRDANGETLHRTRESFRRRGFDHEVHVVTQHGELDDSHVEPIRGLRERAR